MFKPQVLLDDGELCAEPLLKRKRRLNNRRRRHQGFTLARVPRERCLSKRRSGATRKWGSAPQTPPPASALSVPSPRRPCGTEPQQSSRQFAPSPLLAYRASSPMGCPAESLRPSSAATDRRVLNSC